MYTYIYIYRVCIYIYTPTPELNPYPLYEVSIYICISG